MADNGKKNSNGGSTALTGMLVFAVTGALLVGGSFWIITRWPLPVAVAPYFEDSLFQTGAIWGFIVGGFVGWIIGWLTDESRFTDATYE